MNAIKSVFARTLPKSMPGLAKSAWAYFRLLALAVALALLIKEMLIEAYNIPTSSMEKTLLVGDFLLADKVTFGARIPLVGWRLPALRDPQVGDVVVFRFPSNRRQSFIKRIVATGGQEIRIANKVVYVDGNARSEPANVAHNDSTMIPASTGYYRDNFGPITIPAGHYFLMGDNRDNSSDSRFWGTVPRENILGRALFIHWSWETDPDAPRITWWNPLSWIWGTAYYLYLTPTHVRWSRLMRAIR